jgi:hypothetical protein
MDGMQPGRFFDFSAGCCGATLDQRASMCNHMNTAKLTEISGFAHSFHLRTYRAGKKRITPVNRLSRSGDLKLVFQPVTSGARSRRNFPSFGATGE